MPRVGRSSRATTVYTAPMKSTTIMRRLLYCLAISLITLPCSPAELTGRVVKAQDGDTITVPDVDRVHYKIRLAGIDAPESHQAFGTRSRQNLAGMVFGKDALVEWNKLDRYGRTVGVVFVNARDANLEQVPAPYPTF